METGHTIILHPQVINYIKPILYVKFKSEKVYRYFDVSKEVYNGLKTADSVGSCFSKAIKPVYRYEKVEFEEHFDDGSHTIDV